MRMDKDWDIKAKRLLQSELTLKGISHERLQLLLNEIGVNTTKASIDNKISRGSFSAAFLLQCLAAIGCEVVNVGRNIGGHNEKR